MKSKEAKKYTYRTLDKTDNQEGFRLDEGVDDYWLTGTRLLKTVLYFKAIIVKSVSMFRYGFFGEKKLLNKYILNRNDYYLQIVIITI